MPKVISLDIAKTSVEITELRKGLSGKISVAAAHRFPIDSEKDWKTNVEPIIKDQKIAVTVSDSKVYLHRIPIPGGAKNKKKIKEKELLESVLALARELIPEPLGDLVYNYQIVGSEVLFIATNKKNLVQFLNLFRASNTKVDLIAPESIASYHILKDAINEGETILYIDIGAELSTLSFVDHYGPIMTFSESVEVTKLKKELNEALAFYKERYKKKLGKIILGGGGSLNVDLKAFSKEVGVKSLSVNDILQDKLKKMGVKVNLRSTPEILFLNSLGLGLLAMSTDPLNLAKEELMALPQKQPQPKAPKQTEEQVETPKNQERSNKGGTAMIQRAGKAPGGGGGLLTVKNIILLVVVVAAVVAAGYLGYSYWKDKKSGSDTPITPTEEQIGDAKETTESEGAESEEENAEKAREEAEKLRLEVTKLNLRILNGVGTVGLAAETSKTLTDKGYENVEVGSAVNFDFQETTVEVKEASQALVDVVIKDLGMKPAYESETLDDSSSYDLIITIGANSYAEEATEEAVEEGGETAETEE